MDGFNSFTNLSVPRRTLPTNTTMTSIKTPSAPKQESNNNTKLQRSISASTDLSTMSENTIQVKKMCFI